MHDPRPRRRGRGRRHGVHRVQHQVDGQLPQFFRSPRTESARAAGPPPARCRHAGRPAAPARPRRPQCAPRARSRGCAARLAEREEPLQVRLHQAELPQGHLQRLAAGRGRQSRWCSSTAMRPPVAALRSWWAMPAPSCPSVRSCSLRRTSRSYWPSRSVMRLIETARSRISSSRAGDGHGREIAPGDRGRLVAQPADRPHEPLGQDRRHHDHRHHGQRPGGQRRLGRPAAPPPTRGPPSRAPLAAGVSAGGRPGDRHHSAR